MHPRSYSGTTTIRKAIQNSINVVAVKCLEEVNLRNLAFSTWIILVLPPLLMKQKQIQMKTVPYGQMPIFLWPDDGVTNIELCAAYAAIANQGNYIEPLYYTKILGP